MNSKAEAHARTTIQTWSLAGLSFLLGTFSFPTLMIGGSFVLHGLSIKQVGPDQFEARIEMLMAIAVAAIAAGFCVGGVITALREGRIRLMLAPLVALLLGMAIGLQAVQSDTYYCNLYFPGANCG